MVGAVISHSLMFLDLGGRLFCEKQRRCDDYRFEAQAALVVYDVACANRITHGVGNRGLEHMKNFHFVDSPILAHGLNFPIANLCLNTDK